MMAESTTVLQAMKEAQQEKIRKTAEIIIKYQKFKNSIIAEKIGGTLTKSSKMNYITCARHFLRTGQKYKNICGNSFYKYLQECIDKHIQPLTPSFEDKLRETKRIYTKKETNLPITNTIPKKISAKIEWGIKINDKIVLETNEDRARAFLKGIKFLNKNNNTDIKLVTLEIQEIKDED